MGGIRWWFRAPVRVPVAAAAFIAALVATAPVEAQQILAQQVPDSDSARVSGFIWRSKPSGFLEIPALAEIPGFEARLGIENDLGINEVVNGWILEGNFGNRRHRFIVELSRQESAGDAGFMLVGVGSVPLIDLVVNLTSTLSLREAHAYYNLLIVSRPQVELGILGGVGYFDAEAFALASGLGSARAQLDTPFPTIGGNLLVNPRGPVRGYLEITGFPRVKVDDELEGEQLDFVARVEAFVIRNVGLVVGYRRYRLTFDPNVGDLRLDLTWDGFTFGGQVRF